MFRSMIIDLDYMVIGLRAMMMIEDRTNFDLT